MYVWIFISFAVPIIDARVPGWWQFPQPAGNTSWGEIAIAALTFLFFIAAMLQWGVTRTVARLTAASLEETRRSNELTLRAWVLVERIHVTKSLGAVQPGSFIDRPIRVTIRNYGKLPALQVTRLYELIPPGAGFPSHPPPIPGTPGNRILAAGESHTFPLPIGDTFSSQELDEIERGNGVLMLTARFTYTDALTTTGDSSYCWFYSPNHSEGRRFVYFPLPRFGVS